MTKLLKKTFGLVALLVCLWGCASTPDEPVFLIAADSGPEGYTLKDGTGSFESKRIRISAKPLRPEELTNEPDVIGILANRNYIILRMEVENTSTNKLILNPAYVTLTTDANDYSKTLDYTDIYTIMAGDDEDGVPVTGLKGQIYDLTLTLAPGDKTSRLLIFRPVDVDAESAELVLRNIYIGKADINVTMPLLKYEKTPEEKRKLKQEEALKKDVK